MVCFACLTTHSAEDIVQQHFVTHQLMTLQNYFFFFSFSQLQYECELILCLNVNQSINQSQLNNQLCSLQVLYRTPDETRRCERLLRNLISNWSFKFNKLKLMTIYWVYAFITSPAPHKSKSSPSPGGTAALVQPKSGKTGLVSKLGR